MTEPGEFPSKEPRTFPLRCGAEKSNLRQGWYAISDGSYHPEPPFGIAYSPGVGSETQWLSGEALILPKDRAVGVIVGRNEELRIDCDLVTTSELLSRYPSGESEGVDVVKYASVMQKLDEAAKAAWGEGVEQFGDFGDLGVSRHHLQISYHPEGVAVVTYDPSLGTKPEQYTQGKSWRANYPTILRQYKEEPTTHQLNWITFQGSSTLRDGDAVVIDGKERKYCLRFFAARKNRPAMFVKQVYPLDASIETLHRNLIITYAEVSNPGPQS